ncbi:glucose-6-phosphate exchanger SLC37A2-like isoform X3 [Bolinopsis microptera]|uniref:glucose-6-phosphate exchanger SLC37A2-like isoform X3 n=1 Tax=Bolinopsis microptera TaxID=2820187 RepID=UPI00307A5011
MGSGMRYDPVPLGIKCFKHATGPSPPRNIVYKCWILALTFFVYMSYHMNRKSLGVVKSTLHGGNCSDNTTSEGWAPFNGTDGTELLGYLDTAFLLSYAIFIFACGSIADTISLRYFLTVGMIGTSIFMTLMGMARYFEIHSLAYFVIMQIIIGAFQATGWPAVVAVIGNWVGKGSRGLIMGIWNSHTSVGNILGGLIAGAESNSLNTWGLSFIYPAIVIGGLGIVVFLFLPTNPQAVGLPPPNQSTTEEDEERLIKSLQHHSDDSDDEGNIIRDPNSIPAISFCKALRIPGVMEFSIALFFAKLVCYTFLFCLPDYVHSIKINGTQYDSQKSADIATFYDIGGILGSIICGLLADKTGCNAIVCIVFQILSVPLLYVYYQFGTVSMSAQLGIMFVLGFFSNGPYALITTAVSADLGTSEAIRGSSQALATVSAIIDGSGSIGATLGPYITSVLTNHKDGPDKYQTVFTVLEVSAFIAALCLLRVMIKEISKLRVRRIRRITMNSTSIQSSRRFSD